MSTAADVTLATAFDTWLADRCPPATVRAIEGGASSEGLWRELEAGGWLDALVPEALGGAGLALPDVRALVEACGYRAVPLPIAETMVARGVQARAGGVRPAAPGPVALAALDAVLGQDARRTWQAALTSALIAGAAARVLGLSIAHAQQRVQFGRPIGSFQAVQHRLAVMAEEASAARMAAQLAFAARGDQPDAVLAAMAKSVAGEAAAVIAAGGHAVHGAIGIAAECDLQLYTRRLLGWRTEGGSPAHAAKRVADAWWSGESDRAIDFMLARLSAAGH
ncbi:MAG TPA: acyl-CoA dehydrogenase family protein [Caldimonas sp.]|nr:acyl-CoA dehydrogenase family protein [Caldimonas sp.]